MPSLSESHELDQPLICPYCGAKLDGQVVASADDDVKENATPDVGQMGVCFSCAGIQVFDLDIGGKPLLRKPDPEEEVEAGQNKFLRFLQARVMDLRHGITEDDRQKNPMYDPDAVDQDKVVAKIAIVRESPDDGDRLTTRIRVTKGVTEQMLVGVLRQMADAIESDLT